MTPILEMNHITKTFPGVRALDDVSVHIMPNEIHSIVGENGAGKSTLMKVLSGVYPMDSGEIIFKGKKVTISSPKQAIDLGIGTVYQNLNLIPALSVAENIYMNQFPKKGLVIDQKEIFKNAEQVLGLLKCNIDPNALVETLSVADQQMVAIARVLSRKISVLILDEPTSSLSPTESQRLFDNVNRLKAMGVSTIFISHHMEEIFSVSEHVTVLCDGKLVGDWCTKDIDEKFLVKEMVGHEIKEIFPKVPSKIGNELLKVEHLTAGKYVHDVSFSVRKEEILGIGGLVGAGRTWLVKSIFGVVQNYSGTIILDGKKVVIKHPWDAKQFGIGFVPEDRREEALIGEMSIKENIGICNLNQISTHGFLNNEKETELATNSIKDMNIKTPSPNQLVKNLSGGNQQKVVLGKWFATNPKVMIFDEPTKGIDVGAKSEIHRRIGELAAMGMGIIMISSELPELMGISDRIIVLSLGRKTAEFERKDFDATKIMLAAASNQQ